MFTKTSNTEIDPDIAKLREAWAHMLTEKVITWLKSQHIDIDERGAEALHDVFRFHTKP